MPIGAEKQGKIAQRRDGYALRRAQVIQIGSKSGLTAGGMP
jgi:hypothetical protein